MGDETEGMDRISDLPTFIIHHIMSYLSSKDVAKTSVLSKRWSYLRASFPIFDFDQCDYFGEVWEEGPDDERFYELTLKFVEFVNTALDQFCKLKLRMLKFRILIGPDHVKEFYVLLNRWISAAVEHGVQDLNVDVKIERDRLYNLPQTIFNARSITTLKLSGCKLEQPSDGIRFCFLKSLTLDKVYINEQMVHKFTSDCPLLEKLYIFSCWGIKYFCISGPLKLKILHIKQSLEVDHLESIKIVVPRLQKFTLWLEQIEPFVIDLSGCQHLKVLRLLGVFFKDQEFHNFISKFPWLEKLAVDHCRWLEKIMISSFRLKELLINNCINLKAIDVDTPNLVSFTYMFNPVPKFSINAPCLRRVAFLYHDADASWYLNTKEFLRASNQIFNLSIFDLSSRTTFNLEDFQNYPSLPPCGVESLTLRPQAFPSNYAALVHGIFWICHPKFLFIEGLHKNKFIKWFYSELKNENVNCCNSFRIKCWRHNLKDFVVKRTQTKEDVEPLDINNLPDEWSANSCEKLQFCLEWSFPAYDSIDIGS